MTLTTGNWVPAGDLACCTPPPSLGEATCFETELEDQRALIWRVTSPLPDEHAGQYLYRYAELPAFSCPRQTICILPPTDWNDYAGFRAFSAYPSTLERAPEYCLTVEAQSLLSGEVFSSRRCVADPASEIERRPREDFSNAISIYQCAEPPAGYEDEYCTLAESSCSADAREELHPSDRPPRDELCAGYDESCVDHPPPAGGSGCSAGGAEPGGPGWLAALSALALFARRRRRPLDTDS